jgi:hypothetical protein
MEDINEPSGSVVLQPKGGDMSFNAELASRNNLLKEQRYEMAENQVKRTRHPFSGYKQLLNYDRTEPKVKMIKRGHTSSGLDEEMMGDVKEQGLTNPDMKGGATGMDVETYFNSKVNELARTRYKQLNNKNPMAPVSANEEQAYIGKAKEDFNKVISEIKLKAFQNPQMPSRNVYNNPQFKQLFKDFSNKVDVYYLYALGAIET